ncbi:MAG: YbaK/EbsC family protein [Anaerolineales bacterium]|jgi:prolyl-tRNA editing enzyme YbaK/EbsC (Cys-tRNA(Pro) deacylase)
MLDSNDLQAYLRAHHILAKVMHLENPTPTVTDAAVAVGVEPDQIIKSLLFMVDERPVLAIANGLQDVERRALARYFNVGRKRVKLAGPQKVLDISGYPVGGVPPVGWKTDVQAFINPAILKYDVVYAGGGEINVLVEMSPEDIQRLSGAIEYNLTLSEAET